MTRLGETASRLVQGKATSKPFLEFFSLFALVSPLPLCVCYGRGGIFFFGGMAASIVGGERSHYALTLEAYRSNAEGEGGHTDAVTTLRCSAASSSQKAKKEG